MPDVVRIPDVVELAVEVPFWEPENVNKHPTHVEHSHHNIVEQSLIKRTRIWPKYDLQ